MVPFVPFARLSRAGTDAGTGPAGNTLLFFSQCSVGMPGEIRMFEINVDDLVIAAGGQFWDPETGTWWGPPPGGSSVYPRGPLEEDSSNNQ